MTMNSRNQFFILLCSQLLLFTVGCDSSKFIESSNTNNSINSNISKKASTLAVLPQFQFVPVNKAFKFTAIGGTAPYTFSLTPSLGTIDSTGLYTAPGSPTIVTLTVTDVSGEMRDATIMVNLPLSCAPADSSLTYEIEKTDQISCTGGAAPYSYSTQLGGGIFDSDTPGLLIPGWLSSIQVTIKDAVGNLFTSSVSMSPSVREFGPVFSGSSQMDQANAVMNDSSGNIIVAGTTYGSFDGQINSGYSDGYLIKYDANGIHQWTKFLGSSQSDTLSYLQVDQQGNIWAAGKTNGSILNNVNQGGFDGVVAKYDPNGNVIWATQVGTSGDESIQGLFLDASGNAYVVGYTTGSFPNFTLQGAGDLFIAKFSPTGVQQFLTQLGSAGDDHPNGIVVDSIGNMYVAGYTNGSLNSNVGTGGNDIFLMKLNSSGVVQWTQQKGTNSSGDNEIQQLAWDSDGNLYLVGFSDGNFDGISNSAKHILVMKYSSPGIELWSKLLTGGTQQDAASSVVVDQYGAIYLSGYTTGSFSNSPSMGNSDALLVKLSSDGVVQWSQQWGSAASDQALGISLDSNHHIYLSGYTQTTMGGMDGVNSPQSGQNFIAKFNSSGVRQ